jgi:hypothetical protein
VGAAPKGAGVCPWLRISRPTAGQRAAEVMALSGGGGATPADPIAGIMVNQHHPESCHIVAISTMSASVQDAQTQWLEQLAAMRKAIAELNLPAQDQKLPAYGDDLEFDDDDFSGTASGEDIWDIISDEYEDEYSSDHLEQFSDAQPSGTTYSQQWLAEKCASIAQRSSGLDAGALKDQISAVLASDSNGKMGT